jgi:uncharacterized protein (DUF169 family)
MINRRGDGVLKIEEINRMGIRLEQWLRMRVHPIAVKLLKDNSDIPSGTIIPSRDLRKRLNLCQAFSMAQRNGECLALFKQDHWCFEPIIGLGIAEHIPKFLSGYHRYPDSVRDEKAAMEWCRNMPYLQYGIHTGVIVAPIHNCSFIPDVIVMHINGMMTSQLLIVKNWIDGKDIICQLSGHAGCVYAIVPAFQSHDCYVAIPCRGDRQVAMAQDDEVFFSLVPEMLPDFMSGIDVLENNNWGIPMKHFLKEEVEMRPKYVEMAELLGMEVSQYVNKKDSK